MLMWLLGGGGGGFRSKFRMHNILVLTDLRKTFKFVKCQLRLWLQNRYVIMSHVDASIRWYITAFLLLGSFDKI